MSRQLAAEEEEQQRIADNQLLADNKESEDQAFGEMLEEGAPFSSGMDMEGTNSALNDAIQRGWTSQQLEASQAKHAGTWCERMRLLVLSPKFDSIIGAVIIGNTLVMSLQLEY